MRKSTDSKRKGNLVKTVGFRITSELYDYYARLADMERRDVSDVCRIALEEQAQIIKQRGDRLLPAS
jgi:hypothetical protein